MRASSGVYAVVLLSTLACGRALAKSAKSHVLAVQPLIDEDSRALSEHYQPILEQVLDAANVAYVPFFKVEKALAKRADRRCHRKLSCLVMLANAVGADRVLSIAVSLRGRRVKVRSWFYTSYGAPLRGANAHGRYRKHGHGRAAQLKWALTQFIRKIRKELPTRPPPSTGAEMSGLVANLVPSKPAPAEAKPAAKPPPARRPAPAESGLVVAISKPSPPAPVKPAPRVSVVPKKPRVAPAKPVTKVASATRPAPQAISPLPAKAATEPSPESAHSSSSSWMCPVCYIVAGVGVVGLGAGLMFHFKAHSDVSSIESQLSGVSVPPEGTPRSDLISRIASSQSHAHLANAFMVGGAAVLAGGVVLFVLDRVSGSREKTDSMDVSLGATPRYVSATVHF